jgi:hypothetical protein
MAMSRHRPPPEDDLQPAVEKEMKKPVVEVRPPALSPTVGQPPLINRGRDHYFHGAYGTSDKPAEPEMSVNDLLTKFQLPASLNTCILWLIAVGRSHGVAEAIIAAGKDPALLGAHRDRARQLLASVFHEGS